MPAEIIITSVPRGLDGGSGFQTVKRTREMSLAVSERLHQRSGYTHRFAAGDKRNPVIISHQIEKLKAGVFHVLGLIKDAGTDHSGRQNRLAHLIAFDETDVYGNQAGPASVAKQLRDSRLLIDSWDQQPHEAEPLAIPSFNVEPGICQAWIDAGLDPGVAGELAEAAATGKKSVLVVPASTDVITLFADAMLLMPPGTRWKTTFTTCGSGSEDYVWQAVRADLAEANDARKLPGVIDLTQAYSGKDSPYASFAKTGKGQLPWQQSVPDVPDVETDSAPPIGSQVPPSSTQVTPPLHSQEVTNASGSTTAPQLDSSNAMQSQGSQPKKRKLSELSSVPAKVPSTSVQTNFLRNAALVVASSLFLALIVLVAINVEVISAYIAKVNERFGRQPIEFEQVAKRGEGSSTFKVPSKAEEKDWRKEQEDADKEDNEEQELEDFEKLWSPKYEDRLDGLLARLKQNIRRAKNKAREIQQKDAFAQFEDLPESVSLCSAISYMSSIKISSVKIGSVQWDLLVSPKISLATPEDFSAQVEEINIDSGADDGIKRMWSITVKGASVGDPSGVSLVEVYVESSAIDGEPDCLRMRPTERFKQETNDGQNLLRSLLLLTAIDPKTGEAKEQAIQLFKPLGVQKTDVDFFRTSLSPLILNLPKAIQTLRKSDELVLSLLVVAPCDVGGTPKETLYRDSFDQMDMPTREHRSSFTLIKGPKDHPEATREYRSLVEYYFDEEKPELLFRYKHQIKGLNSITATWQDREYVRSDFDGIAEPDDVKYADKRSKRFKRLKFTLDTQYKFEKIKQDREGFDKMQFRLQQLLANQGSEGWFSKYWEKAKEENKKKKKEQAEDNAGKPPVKLSLRYENISEWVAAINAARRRSDKDAKEIFNDEKESMFNYFKSWWTQFTDDFRDQNLSLVKTSVEISITSANIVALGVGGKKYPVVLIDQDAQPPEDRSSNDGKGASLN